MKYSIVSGSNNHVIFHLHGTGGNSSSLFSIGQLLDKEATLVGIDGDVFENGMRRYFKRYDDLSFDLDNLDVQTEKLHKVIKEIIDKEYFGNKQLSLLGYSNGANIAINLLKKYSMKFDYFILFHPTLVNPGISFKKQQKLQVLLTYGEEDPYVDKETFKALKKEFSKDKIKVKTFTHNKGHRLLQEEVLEARRMINKTT